MAVLACSTAHSSGVVDSRRQWTFRSMPSPWVSRSWADRLGVAYVQGPLERFFLLLLRARWREMILWAEWTPAGNGLVGAYLCVDREARMFWAILPTRHLPVRYFFCSCARLHA